MKLSNRHITKISAIEKAKGGTGVSTGARIFARKYYSSWGWEDMARMRNVYLNDILEADFSKGAFHDKFKLRDGHMAEIRKTDKFYYVGKVREDGGHDIIIIQQTAKPPRTKSPGGKTPGFIPGEKR